MTEKRKILNEELNRLSEEEFKNAEKNSIQIVLDNVRSMQNVGSVFRSSDAFLVEHVHLCGITATPPHRDILKTALGATETVSWSYHKETLDCIQMLKENGYTVYSVEQVEHSISLEKFAWQKGEKVAFVFGHEVKGVQQEVVNASHHCIEIPQWGTKHSFNISVCTGMVLWQAIATSL